MRRIRGRNSHRFAALVAAVLLVVGAASARAEPVVLTGGSAFLSWDSSFSSAVFTAPQYNLPITYTGGGTMLFQSGTTSNLGGSLFPSFLNNPLIGASQVTVNGTTMTAFVVAGITFTTPSFVVPSIPVGTTTTLTLPFLLAGRIQGYESASTSSRLLFDLDVTGAGTASSIVSSTPGNPDILRTGGVLYEIESAAATPEPASMLLFGTGAGLIAMRVRRRGRNRKTI